jgi:hypothetical protein
MTSLGDRPRYDDIGVGYAHTRREDPHFRALINAALGDARTVVNVGAGAGSYEPADRHVIAIEPSDVMAAQRPPELAPAVQAGAGDLPLRDAGVDAAMAIVTLHHWDASGESPGGDSLRDSLAGISYQERGVRELRRVARGPVVILTYDPRVSATMWLMADYLPEVAALDHTIFPHPELLADWLGGEVVIESVPIPRDTPDWMLGSFWAHPERVLDPDARAATSGFARMPPEIVDRCVAAVAADLASGAWDERHGHLRALDAHDVGLRLVVAQP